MIYQNPNNTIIEDKTLLELGFFEEIDRWKTHNQNHAIQVFKSNCINDDDYEKLKYNIEIMKTEEEYDNYKKAFDRFCYFCHIVPRGVILKTYELKKSDKPNHNSLRVEYSYNTKKIELPEDVVLYHMSSVQGIKELIPCFRGKAVKGFMYDKPRVYFTIRKNMPKFLADYRNINDKVYMYECKENIKKVFVDPLVWANFQGAVYVETNTPIKVQEITKERFSFLKKKQELTAESTKIDFDDFYNFVTENGLTIVD